MYKIKVRAKKGFENKRTGERYKKGKTYSKEITNEQAIMFKQNREMPEYKVISLRKTK